MAGKRRFSQRTKPQKLIPIAKVKVKSRATTSRQKANELKTDVVDKIDQISEQDNEVSKVNSRSISPNPIIKRIISDDEQSINNDNSPKSVNVFRQKRIYISDEDDDIQEIIPKPISRQNKQKKQIQDSDNSEIQVLRSEYGRIQDSEENVQDEIEEKSNSHQLPKNQRKPQNNEGEDLEKSPQVQKTSRRLANKRKVLEDDNKFEVPKARVSKVKNDKIEVFKMDKRRKSAHRARKVDDEDVAAEFGVVLLRPTTNSALNRIQFQNKQLQTVEGCKGRLKRQVKHLELNYKTRRNQEGNAYNKLAALHDGVYKAESSSKGETLLRHTVGFFKSDQFYLLPIRETYEMSRRIMRPIDIDIIRQSQLEDANAFQANTAPVLNPVRVRYARQETEWQRKRREQSSQYRQMLYEQDQWLDIEVKKEDVRLLYKKAINKSKRKDPLPINESVNLSGI